jgi:hypothetical protein
MNNLILSSNDLLYYVEKHDVYKIQENFQEGFLHRKQPVEFQLFNINR